jgi:hypothetical protein
MPVKGRCHCGAIQFEVPQMPTELSECNCSFCVRRGALGADYPQKDFKLLTAPDRVSTYQWGTYVGSHHYCAVCGIGTHSVFPNFETGKPDFDDIRVGVNARLFEDLAWEQLPVRKENGREGW